MIRTQLAPVAAATAKAGAPVVTENVDPKRETTGVGDGTYGCGQGSNGDRGHLCGKEGSVAKILDHQRWKTGRGQGFGVANREADDLFHTAG